MRIGELFSGYGGLGMGVQSVLGGDIAWHSDVDKGACKILAHRYPDVPNLGDITTVDWSRVEPVDVLTGGSPCQDLSHAGKRGGMTEGTRSNLWVAMREAIAQLRPAIVVWENVEGAASAGADSELETRPGLLDSVRRRDGQPVLRALGRVVGDLSSLGYVGRVGSLRAADIGAPHGRRRRFLVAYADSEGRGGIGWQLPERRDADRRRGADGPRSQTESSARGGLDVAPDASGRLAGAAAHGVRALRTGDGAAAPPTGGPFQLLPTPNSTDHKGSGATQGRVKDGRPRPLSDADLPEAVALLPTPTVQDGANTGGASQFDRNSIPLNALVTLLPTPRATQPGYADDGRGGKSLDVEARLLPTPMVGSTSPAAHGQISGQWRDAMAEALNRWGDYAAAIARWETVLGRPAPAPTMTSAKGNPQLSPRFVEWMMGLPAGWVTDVPGITRNEALRALGNGVCPPQCAAALRLMLTRGVAA